MINPRSLLLSLALAAGLTSSAVAAPVTYRFTTSDTPFGDGTVSTLLPLLQGGAAGTFVYNNDFPGLTRVDNADGSYFWRGFSPQSATGIPTTLSALSGTVAGFSFSDVSGATQVGNDDIVVPGFPTNVDMIQLVFDPFPGSTSVRNLTGFTTANGWVLQNVRMFWQEGQQVPELIPDLLNDQNLPSALPSIHGRVALDFFQANDPTQTRRFVFFDGLTVTAVPEPQTYLMLATGLAMLGFMRLRRKQTL